MGIFILSKVKEAKKEPEQKQSEKPIEKEGPFVKLAIQGSLGQSYTDALNEIYAIESFSENELFGDSQNLKYLYVLDSSDINESNYVEKFDEFGLNSAKCQDAYLCIENYDIRNKGSVFLSKLAKERKYQVYYNRHTALCAMRGL